MTVFASWDFPGPPPLESGPRALRVSRLCRVVAVQAHGEAALPAGALHGPSLCCLTFELRRPERTDALPDWPTMTTGLSGKAAGRGGSPLERGVRQHC